MSLFEWLGESRAPGPTGDVEFSAPSPSTAHTHVIVLRGLLGALMLAGALYAVWHATDRALSVVVLLVYLGVAYLAVPRPDVSNVGWFGGLVDHPFRWSDDWNRGLVFFRLLLWPGRFTVGALRDVVQRLRGRRFIVLRARDD